MNAADFSRNFAGSWFGIPYGYLSQFQVGTRPPGGVLLGKDLAAEEISPNALVPCTRPRFADNGRTFSVRCILPSRIREHGTGFVTGLVEGIPWEMDFDETAYCVAKTPGVGMVPDALGLAYLTISPARSTARGLCLNNCEMTTITRSTRGLFGSERTDGLTLEGVWFAFNPEFCSIREALVLLTTGARLGVPLTKYLGAHLVEHKKYPVIAYKQIGAVGSIRDATTIKLYPEISAQCERYILKQYPFISFIK
jgi:hypothetical protein